MRSPFSGGTGSSSSTSDSAEDAQDEFASGGDFFDEPFDAGPQDSAEEAQDEFASGGGGGGGSSFDDDDDDDPVSQSTDTAEDAQDTFAGGGGGGGGGSDDRLEPPTDPPEQTVDQPEEPLDPDLGDTVSQAEAREVIERSAETGRPVQNLEERGALSAQIEGLTGVDPRTVASETGRDVGLRDGRLTLEGDRAGQRRRRSQVTEVNQDIEDDLGSAEAAQDAFAAGLLGSPTLGTEDAAEGAQDLGAGGLLGTDRISPRRSGAIDPFDAEAAQDASAALNARDIATDPAEAAQDTAARTARRGERFGDIDFSLGFGGPQDEVEEFTDETLPSTIGDAGEAVGLDVLRDRLTDPPRVDAAPPGRLGAATSPATGGGFVAESLFRVGEDLAQLPGQGLEAVELAEFLAEPSVRDGGESSRPFGVVQLPTGDIEESTTRAGQVGTAAAGVGAATVESARENPRQTAADVLTGVGLSVGGGLALGRGARLARARARTAGATDVEPTDLAGEDVIDTFDPDVEVESGQRFPPFRDPDVDPETQREAFAEQSAQFTPEEITERFGGDPPEDAVDAVKALDVEPEGEAGGRGFQAPESDTEAAEEFESVGTSVGPELSPNFLRVGDRPEFRLRPGLPSLGGQPTAAIIRTELTDTDAPNLDRLNQELLEAEEAGDVTARTLPPDEFSPGEAEAVLPPGAVFEQVGDAGVLRQVGVGSDFATDVAGARVPIRLFRDPDLDVDDAATLGDDVRDFDLDELSDEIDGDLVTASELRRRARGGGRAVDRPAPVGPFSISGRSRASESDGRQASAVGLSEPTSRARGMDRARQPTSPGPSGAPSGGSFPPFSDIPSRPDGAGGGSALPSGGSGSEPPTGTPGTPSGTPSDPPDDDPPIFTPPGTPSIQGDDEEDDDELFDAIDDTGIVNPVRRLSEVDDDLVESLDTFEGDNAN